MLSELNSADLLKIIVLIQALKQLKYENSLREDGLFIQNQESWKNKVTRVGDKWMYDAKGKQFKKVEIKGEHNIGTEAVSALAAIPTSLIGAVAGIGGAVHGVATNIKNDGNLGLRAIQGYKSGFHDSAHTWHGQFKD